MAQKLPSLGIKRLEGLHYYVRDLERSRRFYCERLDFRETARSTRQLEEEGRQRSAVFQAADVTVVCSQPIGTGGRAWRYLQKHPDGVGTVVFEVEDAERCFRLLEERGATPIDEIATHKDDGGTLRSFSITTPFGDSTFRFMERRGYRDLFPGIEPYAGTGANRFGFSHIDHVTSNFQTMKPALLWMEHVMGWEKLWEVKFHTSDVSPGRNSGSGLKSEVMWDPVSQAKFANNEPMRPFFKNSQINLFNEELRGDGIQHAALVVKDIVTAVRGLRGHGVHFMPTPGSYYDMLPERLQRSTIGRIDEDLQILRDLEILVDGNAPGKYMLQIFLKESSGAYNDPSAGPFFYEIIQRKGDQGFGAGNFRALFESIEREQLKRGMV
jgi:4-hydroxyphenylpyruvate dioxygenase